MVIWWPITSITIKIIPVESKEDPQIPVVGMVVLTFPTMLASPVLCHQGPLFHLLGIIRARITWTILTVLVTQISTLLLVQFARLLYWHLRRRRMTVASSSFFIILLENFIRFLLYIFRVYFLFQAWVGS